MLPCQIQGLCRKCLSTHPSADFYVYLHCSLLRGNRSFRKRVVSPTASSQTPWVDTQPSDNDKIIIENGARFEFAFDLLHDAKFEIAFHVPS